MDSHLIINLLHILLIAPFLIWVGISRNTLPNPWFIVVLVLGIIVTVYHAYKALIRYTKGSSFIWVNLIHALWVGPLLIYIGARKENAPRWSFELLLLTAFSALGYHLYNAAVYYDFK